MIRQTPIFFVLLKLILERRKFANKKNVSNFFKILPKLESNYCRKSTKIFNLKTNGKQKPICIDKIIDAKKTTNHNQYRLQPSITTLKIIIWSPFYLKRTSVTRAWDSDRQATYQEHQQEKE